MYLYMKKFVLLIFFVVIAGLEVKAQRELLSYEELKSEVVAMNAEMPMSMGFSMQMNSADIDREKLTYFASCNSLVKDVQKISQEVIKNNVIAALSSPSEELKLFLRSLMALNLKLRYVFEFPQIGKTIDLCFTSNDMDRIINDKYSPEEKLDMLISTQTLTLPLDTGQGMTMVDLCKKDGYVEYIFNVDETIVDVNDLIIAKERIRQSLIQLLGSDHASMQQGKIITKAGYGIAYLYVGSTTKTALRIELSYNDLKSVLNKENPVENNENDSQDNYLDVDSIAVEDDFIDLDSTALINYRIDNLLWEKNPINHFLGQYDIMNDRHNMLYNYYAIRKRRLGCII